MVLFCNWSQLPVSMPQMIEPETVLMTQPTSRPAPSSTSCGLYPCGVSAALADELAGAEGAVLNILLDICGAGACGADAVRARQLGAEGAVLARDLI